MRAIPQSLRPHGTLGGTGGEGDLPRAAGWPIVGSAPALLRDPLAFLRREHARLGPVFEVRAVRRRFVVIAGQAANRLLSTEARGSLAAGPFWREFTRARGCPHMMLAMDGVDHEKQRRLFREDVSRRVVDAQRNDIVRLTRDVLTAQARGGVLRVRDFTRLLVSRQVHCLLTRGMAPIDGATARALMESFRYETNVHLLGKWPAVALWSPAYRRHRRRADRFLSLLSRRGEGGGWFSTTAEARARHPELFTPGDTRMSLMMPFVAGVDTVGATLAFLLWEVLRLPALKKRVTAAADRTFASAPEGAPSIEALRQVDDLIGTVLETLRLYPSAFGVYRQTTEPISLDGYHIGRGVDVLAFTTATHTDPEHFPSPYSFDIERFRPPRSEHRRPHVFMPYGGGPHVCLGAGMGEGLLLLTTAAILRHFDLELVHPDRTYRPTFDPSLSMPGTFQIRVRGWRLLRRAG